MSQIESRDPLDPMDLTPIDFETSFVDEPPARPADADLVRGRRRRRRRRVVGATAILAMTVAAVTVGGGHLRPSTTDVVPAQSATPTPAASTPNATPESDTAPALRYVRGKGYLDRDGRSYAGEQPAFTATTRNTYDLARRAFDPQRRHLEPYQPDASTGGSAGEGGIQIGQKLGWTNPGQRGQGMLLISISRLDPGQKAVASGDSATGLCSGSFINLSRPCRPARVNGITVQMAPLVDGGFVMDYLQPDGEVASVANQLVFLNNTSVGLKSPAVTPDQVVTLLTDPRLDVIG